MASNSIFIGIGGTGVRALEILRERIVRRCSSNARIMDLELNQFQKHVQSDDYVVWQDRCENREVYSLRLEHTIREIIIQDFFGMIETVQRKQDTDFAWGEMKSGKGTFLTAVLGPEAPNEWCENQRKLSALISRGVNHCLQQIRKLQKNAMQNKLVKFLLGKVRTERKDCFDEMYNDERKMMWEQLYTELEQRQKSLLKDALEMLCGYSGEGTDISKTSEQIREAIKSIMETYNRQGSKRNSLRKFRKIRKKENRAEMQIRLLKRLFDPRKETHGDVGICRNDTISHKGMICRKADVRKECIHDIPNNLTLIQHQTRPSVFLPKLQTLGGNKWIPIMSAA